MLAGLIRGNFLDRGISGKASPDDPQSGRFDFANSFGFSMGGLVERTFQCTFQNVSDMVAIASPHHGALQRIVNLVDTLGSLLPPFSPVFDLRALLTTWSPGTMSLLDYDDANGEDNEEMFHWNNSPCSAPQRDLGLIAGKESTFIEDNVFLGETPNDGVVPARSAFGRPKSGRRIRAFRRVALQSQQDFSHHNFGESKPLRDFSETTVFRVLSDWAVAEQDFFTVTPPELDASGIEVDGRVEGQITVEYNVPHRDTTGIAFVLYLKDGSDNWRIEDGANPDNGLLNNPVAISGNSKGKQPLRLSVDGIIPFPDPDDPTTQTTDIRVLFLRLTADERTAPLDPTGFEFGIP